MPKNRLQETVFTIMMVLVMVYAMICYNIALETGGMKNFVFKAALGEFPIMIVAGFGIIIWGIGNGGQPTGIHNLWSNGGFFSNGWLGMVMSLQMVMFAYGGIEIIGITAGEARDPAGFLQSHDRSVRGSTGERHQWEEAQVGNVVAHISGFFRGDAGLAADLG